MLNFYEFISHIDEAIDTYFEEVDRWFEKEANMRTYKPQNGGWSVNEILEHIALTNHYLLILIDKGKEKALKKEEVVEIDTIHYSERGLDEFEAVGKHNSFYWPRPDHMEPTSMANLHEVREKLKQQHTQCKETLEVLQDGKGILVKTTMSVNGLGKLDVYEYIYFLALHSKRHIEQMMKVKQEYERKS